MKASTDRILVTHVGSLPRSQAVTDVLFARDRGEVADAAAASATIAEAVRDVVRRQVEAGVDVVSDGEMSKISYATYIKDRITGFAGDTPREPGQDLVEFPRILKRLAERRRDREISAAALRRRDSRSKPRAGADGCAEHEGCDRGAQRRRKAFLNAASPGVIALFQPNEYYKTQDEYLGSGGGGDARRVRS